MKKIKKSISRFSNLVFKQKGTQLKKENLKN